MAANLVKGVDLSHHQESVDFTKLKQAGVGFAFLKAAEGESADMGHRFIDPTYHERVGAAAKAKLPVVPYFFFHPKDDPVGQAQFFLSVADGMRTLAVDHEVTDGLGAHDVSSRCDQFCRELVNRGKRVIVYTYRSFAEDGYCRGLEGYPLWIADYPGPDSWRTKWEPRVPPPWGSAIVWQFTASGNVAGIDPCDLNMAQNLSWLDQTPVKPDDHSHSHPTHGKEGDVKLPTLSEVKPPYHYSAPVQAMQELVNGYLPRHGVAHTIAADGKFGPGTKSAVESVQHAAKIGVDGIVGPDTWSHLLGVK